MRATKDQQRAIDLEGCNIIVSAGAGSGKTAVLTERVKRKVLGGIHVNELLVLTFTNAAAAEMKDRIRSAIKETEGLEEELNYIDSAYITTFDAFSLAIIKKYHTKLNISNQIKVTDEAIIDLKKKEILDNIMDEYYLSPKQEFNKLIQDFCLKDDKELKRAILDCYRKIELKYDKTYFLNHYFEIFNEEKQKKWLTEYKNIIKEKQTLIIDLLEEMNSYFEADFVESVREDLTKVINAKDYQEFVEGMDYKGVRLPKNSPIEGKRIKGAIYETLKELKDSYLIYQNEKEIKEELESTTSTIKILIEILKELDCRLDRYKTEEEVYNFNDIARMAIKVVEENEDICLELKNQFKEILIDEYQDTSDTQEKFISLISSNNVYMVGDIKQSIYRFRNANPYIFKSKYDSYRDTDAGEKIDLLQNFRSRREVLEDVNLLFDYVMDDTIGGADYQASHRMVFGNTSYEEEGKTNQDYHMDIITYDAKDLGNITSSEQEAFTIGQDIKNKIENHYQIFDKNTKVLREATYQDFVILLDKSRDFDLYKKVFEYLGLPLTIQKEESLRKEDDLFIFKNLIKMILYIHNHQEEKEFLYSYVSVGRSFLYHLRDEEIYDSIMKHTYQETKLYTDALELSKLVDELNPSQFFRKVLEKVNYDNQLLTIHNIHSYRVRAEYFYNLIKDFEKDGSSISSFIHYLDQLIEEDYDIKFNAMTDTMNSCTIMTIHKSKGLEFPICYYAGFTSRFNLSELKERILFDNDYGIIVPKVDHYYKDTILKILLKKKVKQEEIGERIRLFYVAVTRAKEKIIIVLPEQEEEKEIKGTLPIYEREAYISFQSLIKSIYSILMPYTKKTEGKATKDYLYSLKKKELEKVDTKLKVKELEIDNEILEENHYSKEVLTIPTKEEKEKMKIGTIIHEYLELIDFKKEEEIEKIDNEYIKKKIKDFLESDLIKNRKDCLMMKEYEFLTEENHSINHGIIDLLIEDKEEYIIIDYKLKNIDDRNYDKQVNGYRKYIENQTNKKCRCYLYSILDSCYREVFDESK